MIQKHISGATSLLCFPPRTLTKLWHPRSLGPSAPGTNIYSAAQDTNYVQGLCHQIDSGSSRGPFTAKL